MPLFDYVVDHALVQALPFSASRSLFTARCWHIDRNLQWHRAVSLRRLALVRFSGCNPVAYVVIARVAVWTRPTWRP